MMTPLISMNDIEAILFDLDGTLVQTERLKAHSYARAAVVLSESEVLEAEVIEAFKNVVGRSRYEVADFLLARFNLIEAARSQMEKWQALTPEEAFISIRLAFYERLIQDPVVLQESLWPHNVAALKRAVQEGYKTGLATMSHREQAMKVLDVLDLADYFKVIATRDDVEVGKPDPEIYYLVSSQLQVEPASCLVFEDSVAGVQAALAAGMQVIAVSTPFTHDSLLQAGALPPDRMIHDPALLPEAIDRILGQTQPGLVT